MTNKQIARILRETGALIELTGGNTFRARAYQNASRTIDRLDQPVEALLASDSLRSVAGIGDVLASQVADLVTHGSFDLLDELIASIPPGLLEVLRVKGIGAKKARTLWKALGVTSLEELEEAATIGRLADLPGFGPRSQDSILASVRLYRSYRSQRRYAEAISLVEPLIASLQQIEGVVAVSPTGELRRKMEVVSEAPIVVAAEDVPAVVMRLKEMLDVDDAQTDGAATVLVGQWPEAIAYRLIIAPPDHFGSLLWRSTGSERHCSEFENAFGHVGHTAEEDAIYDAASLPFIVPELREAEGEIGAARDGLLPHLIEFEDLRGVLHNHSTYSDGANSLQEMADAVRARGYSYFGICDHSQSLVIANGLSVERVKQQQDEIRALNEVYAGDGGPEFRVFSGTESDILQDGSLDYPDETLRSFDLVVASIHSHFNMTETEATERLITAIRNPFTRILGHATGRLLLGRTGYAIDHAAVIEACAESGVAIELNANPRRLDMDWRWIRHATERGVLISINPDAHSVNEIDYLRWGVAAARKGWLTPTQCLNTRSLGAFTAWLAERTPRSAWLAE